MKKLSLIIALLVYPAIANAEVWSLDSCVAYALQHNISVKAARLDILDGKQTVIEAKDNFLPSLRGSASQGFSFGRGLTQDNTYADRNTKTFQWGVSLDIPLFQGLSEYRQLNVAKTNLTKLLSDLEAVKDDVTLQVISYYLQVLYTKEVGLSARAQAEYSRYETERQRELAEAGKVAESVLLEAEAQYAQDRLQVITADNDTKTALVNLANLLQLADVDNFDIKPYSYADPQIPSAESVYSDALLCNNSLRSARLGVEVADKQVSLAKAGYIPTLSFSGSIGSSYYNLKGMPNESFREQMRHNYSTYLGFSLNVPIFDGFTTRNRVRKARLQRLSAELEVDRKETELYKTIQLAHVQATGARDKYLASIETLGKTREAFRAMAEKYGLGRATPSEYEQAKKNLFITEVNSIQAHYEYLLRERILRFYSSGMF